jgi:ferredoxin
VPIVLRQRINSGKGKILTEGWIPEFIRFTSKSNASIIFENKKETFSSCLRCHDKPCAIFTDREIIPTDFDRFPAEKYLYVCASQAILNADDSVGAPIIDSSRCIMCGACASRCPIGAIKIVPGIGAVVEDSPNEAFREVDEQDVQRIDRDRRLFTDIKKIGSMLIESDEMFSRLYKSWTVVGDRFPNILSRNLLLCSGVGASIGRKGNNHMRMDIILSLPDEIHGVAEVEFGQEAVLDAPRDILDSLAVLVSRYAWSLESTKALIISDVLPNKRSEYWHIIQDIANVFNLYIGTVTIFSLVLHNWNNWKIDLNKPRAFYADRSTSSYRTEILEAFIGRPLSVGRSPRPQIDIAK